MAPSFDLVTAQRLLYASSFKAFVKYYWNVVSADPLCWGLHLDAITEHLQAATPQYDPQTGKFTAPTINRLVINVAIRHSKSLLTSVLYPAWLWARDPSRRIISATYSKDLTVRDAKRTRQLVEHENYQRLFPVTLTDDTNRQDYYATTKGGHRLSVSIGSRTSGFDADTIIVDDLHDFATRSSEAERRSAVDYFHSALSSRLVYTGSESVIVAGHRVHEDDVYQDIRERFGDDWCWLVLEEEKTTVSVPNKLGWTDPRQPGELLWPERFNAKVLEQEKRKYRHEYSAIFQQEPVSPEGELFKADWFKYYTTEGDAYRLGEKVIPQDKCWRFATVDTAVSTERGSDWTVIQVWDCVNGNMILADQIRKHLDGTRIVKVITAVFEQYRPQFISVESEFIGKFVIDQLRQEGVPVKPFSAKGHGDKQERAVSAEIMAETGKLWLPNGAGWTAEFVKECLAFPQGRNDDQVDAASMAAILAQKYSKTVTEEQQQPVKPRRKTFEELLWADLRY